MHSCIYEGRVAHCRYQPVVHKFWYRLYMAYLDLDELETFPQFRSLRRRWRLAPARFSANDHMQGREGKGLSEAVRDLVEERSGNRPTGPIRLLTQLRHFGYYFSPLNLFYCFDPSGARVESVVGEVTNTPWRQQHHYVLSRKNQIDEGPGLRYAHDKDFHVSPFLEMDYRYHWELSIPGDELKVRLENRRQGERAFDATLMLARRPWTSWQLTRMLVRYPIMTAEIVAAIHWQAFRLWWKKCPVYSHPEKKLSKLNA